MPNAPISPNENAANRPLKRGERVCTNANCAYRGKMTERKRGSFLMLLFLLCMLFVPGVFYWMFIRRGADVICPACGANLGHN